jgi:hypothetical protein
MGEFSYRFSVHFRHASAVTNRSRAAASYGESALPRFSVWGIVAMRADRLGWNGLGLATLGGLVELEVA